MLSPSTTLEGPVFIRRLIFTVLASLSLGPGPAQAADPSPIRMITTATTESGPLNLISRSFARLEPAVKQTIEAQRLTYLVRRNTKDTELLHSGLRELLGNISSGEAAITLQPAQGESKMHALAANFLETLQQSLSPGAGGRFSITEAVDRLQHALTSALTREDMKVFSATVSEEQASFQYLILLDEETSDLLLLSLSRPRF